jgi:hypothetical protein
MNWSDGANRMKKLSDQQEMVLSDQCYVHVRTRASKHGNGMGFI